VRSRSWAKSLFAVAIAFALIAAACGDDDGAATTTAAPGTTTTAAPGTTAATTTTAAPGTTAATTTTAAPVNTEPILLGIINQENTPAGDFSNIREAMEAATEYVNNDLGGVDGRPLELTVCTTDASPEAAALCATEMVEKGVVAVLPGIDFGSAASIPILEEANIPYVGGVPLLPPEFGSPISFQFIGGSAAAFPGQARYVALEQKPDKVVIIHTDNPPGLGAATALLQTPLAAFGVTDVTLVAEAADAADFTPVVAAAAAEDPDVIMVLFADFGCSLIMQAKEALGVTAQMWYPGSCASAAVLESGGAGAEGAWFNSETLYFGADDPEVAIYREKIAEYAPEGHALAGFSQDGFLSIMNVYELFTEIGADNISSESLIAALQGAVDHHSFMAHSYTCDGTVSAAGPAICSDTVRIVQVQNGEIVDVLGDWLSPSG